MVRKKKRVTISDVARMADVSTMTVSRVINNKASISPQTRSRVLDVIDKLGYQPSHIAQSLTNDRTYTLGITVSDIANPFFAELIAGVETVAWKNGYNVILCNTQEDLEREREVFRLLNAKQVDGVIAYSTRLPDDEFFPLLETFPAALVFNRQIPLEIASVMLMDDKGGSELATRHLLESGRNQVGIIAGSENSPSARARIEGYRTAMGPRKQTFERAVPSSIDAGYAATLRLLRQNPDIDGIVCYNDLVAAGALSACKALGRRIPEEIAVIGCDDVPFAALICPTLTTLHVDRRKIGQQMTQQLLQHIEGDETDTNNRITIPQTLIVRESAP
jgi:LacI family transcriptional regulator